MLILAALSIVAAAQRLPEHDYILARERWRCTYPAFAGEGSVTTTIGIFRTHAEDDTAGLYTILQNDPAAIVLGFSDYGNVDVEQKSRRWMAVDMIDRRTREFRRTIIEMDGKIDTRAGRCQPY